ncbi:MAG: transcription termination/antitermination factor NusG [Planctomycetes bacterium]|jgi:transcriptional antiterminator NusG|nr:transcription termination/antitermination factor NusG [Planctomycetota bacterium]
MVVEWYVLRVQAGREDQIKENLLRRARAAGLEEKLPVILSPTERVSEIKGGERTVVERKIYPGYLMIEIDLDDQTLFLVKDTPGVGDFLGNPNKPIPMSQEEVQKITMEAESKETAPAPKIEFDVGDNVRVKEGPFLNFDGVVEEVYPEKGVVRVIVTIFGRATPVDLEYWQTERI